VTTLVRSLPAPRHDLPTPARLPRPVAALLGALALAGVAMLLLASSAHAVITGAFGVQRRAQPTVKAEPLQYHGGPVLHSSDAYTIYWDPNRKYRGDWKERINRYFQNVGAASGTRDDVFAMNGQYHDASGGANNQSTFRGSYTDEDPYPTSGNCSEAAEYACLTNAQIQAELQHVISIGALPGATGPPVYYVLTPPGVVVCTDNGGNGNCSNSTSSPPNGICGYHSAINSGGPNPIVYAVQPWVAGDAGLFIESENPLETSPATPAEIACQSGVAPLQEPNQLTGVNPWGNYAAGLAEVIINDLSIEQSNIVVDPLLNGWYQTATADEQSDMCQSNFGPPPSEAASPNPETHAGVRSNETINGQSYFIQWAFSSTLLTSGRGYFCWSGVADVPHFTAPNPVNSGDVIGFDGTETLLALEAKTAGLPADEPYLAPIYTWDFGDGTGVSGPGDASVFHAYRYGGTYKAKLTVIDSGDNASSFEEPITVVGPPPPAPGGSGSGTGSSPAATTIGSTTQGSGAKATVAKPKATQTVASHSLSSVLRNGLVIRYSVSERVAGRFEVLLASSIAKKLGVQGAQATGLAKGTPTQTIIAKAILVTTKGGHSSYKIKFSKATAARLRKLGQVSLMIRMVVHNGANPASTTVLDTVKLAR
jgi:PKD domain